MSRHEAPRSCLLAVFDLNPGFSASNIMKPSDTPESDLFTWNPHTHHHTGDVGTSVDAAQHARVFAAGHAGIVYDQLHTGPATASEIANLVGMELYQIRRRITDLSHAGYIIRTGATRPTKSGRQECEWRRRSEEE